MLKFVFCSVVFLILSSVANAQCTGGLIVNCPEAINPQPDDVMLFYQNGQNPHTRKLPLGQVQSGQTGGYLFASSYGVRADGTPEDAQLKAAIDACSARGTKLYLPPGRILLNGSAGTIQLKNCSLEGVGNIQSTQGEVASYGTTILLTSTTVTPFTITSDWSVRGVIFYWPNQLTGTTVYPPLFAAPTLTTSTWGWYLDHVTIVNAYIGIQAGGGSFEISDCYIYAVQDALQIRNIGDSFQVTNTHFTPGPWFTETGSAAAALIGTITQNNSIFHFYSGGLNVINMTVGNVGAFAWRYGIKTEPGVTVAADIDWSLDGIATVIDTTAGGVWAGSNSVPFRGAASCYLVNFTTPTARGNHPCFNLGTGSSLALNGWRGGSVGSFLEMIDGNAVLQDVQVTLGAAADGGDYYAVHTVANSGGLSLFALNSAFSGVPSSIHTHGIKTDVAASHITVQNTAFAFLNESLNVQSAPTTIITGNWSQGITGAQDIVAASLASGAQGVIHNSNQWEKPPTSTISACGTGAAVHGAFSGFLTVGSTNPTTSCVITLPWTPYGAGGGACIFSSPTGAVVTTAAPGGSPPSWGINFTADSRTTNVFFNCAGQN